MKVKFQFVILVSILLFMGMINACYAAVFSIVPAAGTSLPTTISSGQKVNANYTVTNTTGSFHAGNYLKYLPLNVSQVTTDATVPNLCGATFPLAANGSCTLELSVSGPVDASDPNPQHHLFACLGGCTTCCAGTNYPLNVTEASGPPPSTSSISSTLSATVVATGGNFTITLTQTGTGTNVVSATLPAGFSFVNGSSCSVSDSSPTCSLQITAGSAAAGTYSVTPSVVSGGGTGTGSDSIRVSQLYLYISAGPDFYQCPLNGSGSVTSACTSLTNSTSPGFSGVFNSSFATLSGSNYAYVSDTGNSILWECPLNASGAFTACTSLGGSPFNIPLGAAFQTFAGVTYAYVSDFNTHVYQCPINVSTGGFSGACVALSNTNTGFSSTRSVTFATFSGTTYAYVSDNSNNLWKCPVNATTGAFTTCTPYANSTSFFQSTYSSTFATFSGATYVYVPDHSNKLWQCPINTANGAISGGCTALTGSPNTFDFVSSVSFYTVSGTTYAYVSDGSTNEYQCPMNATGGFSGPCTILSTPQGESYTSASLFYVP